MRELAVACGIDVLTGSRTMLGPALVARHVLPPAASRMVGMMAAGELVADKSSRIGNRTDPLPLAARVVLGAMAAGANASRRRRLQATLMGAAGALAGASAPPPSACSVRELGFGFSKAGEGRSTVSIAIYPLKSLSRAPGGPL